MPATTPIIDTPDYQRGVVNAQALLASPAAGTGNVVIGVPPNAETIIVVVPSAPANSTVEVQGMTSLTNYPGVNIAASPNSHASNAWFFDISAAMDTQIKVIAIATPTAQWFVYSDAGVHMIADVSVAKTSLGTQYVVPVAPSALASDHPATELQVAGGFLFASGSTVVAAPGVGKRLRVFYASVANETAGGRTFVEDSTGADILAVAYSGSAGASNDVSFAPSGLPLPANAGITVVGSNATNNATVVYTVETV